MLEFRQRLDAAIRAMPPAGAGHLVATYTAAPVSWTPRHHHCYRVTPPLAGFEHWRPVRVVAQWGEVPLGPGSLAHREMVWAALAHVDTLAELDGPMGYYAIRIRLEGVKVAVANVVKPLIDGVVSSLHCFAGEIPDLVVERLSSSTTTDPGDVRRRLTDRRRAVLGARPNLIRLTKNGIAFNPRDEDCVACVIEVACGNQPRMTGPSSASSRRNRPDDRRPLGDTGGRRSRLGLEGDLESATVHEARLVAPASS
jgi:hypothetical protein